ncbi:ester cyclase [Paraburkholderia acidisoli]|uniref:ester cyclase n=1 Tax=Paraburkholderia acidisoli TaxID=2571748 RepID=UPI001E4CE9E8|nr:ester cyclase [Paraburkholderia acidisoli]
MSRIDDRSETQAEVPEVIRAFYHAFEQRDVTLLRAAVTEDWQYLPTLAPNSEAHGAGQMAAIFAHMSAAFPDIHIQILDVVANPQKVGVRAQVSGTQEGELFGIQGSAKPVRFAIHSFHELRDGLIARTWHLEDWLSVFQQIGEFPGGTR